MASMLRPALRDSNLSLAEETQESQAMVVTTPGQGLSPWTRLGASSTDLHYRLALRASHQSLEALLVLTPLILSPESRD